MFKVKLFNKVWNKHTAFPLSLMRAKNLLANSYYRGTIRKKVLLTFYNVHELQKLSVT